MPVSTYGPSTSQPGSLRWGHLPGQLLSGTAWLGIQQNEVQWVRGSFFISFDIFFHCDRCTEYSFMAWSACCYDSTIFHFSPHATCKHGKIWYFGVLTSLVSATDRWDGWFPLPCVMFTKSAERSLLAACTCGSHTFNTRHGWCH